MSADCVPSGRGRPSAWARLSRNKLAVLGLALVVAIVVISLAAPLLPLPDPDATAPADRLQPPFSPGHVLGTDHLGRDLLSRLIWGTRVSLAVGVVATAIAALVGSGIGLLAGFYGRWVDNILMRGIDMLMAFPYLLLALGIVAVLGPGLLNALYAIAIVNIPFFARSVRGITVGLVRREYVDAARLAGYSDRRILLGELLPNVLPTVVITISTTLGWMILETAGLSFLGLGAQPPQADLGSMLGEGRKLIITAPHVATLPGLVILFLVVGINLLGDGLRDVLDPRLKSGALLRPGAATEVRVDRQKPESGATAALLAVENLRTYFFVGSQIHRAVDGVSFSLQPGECVGIVGESGCGKSVTAQSILGLVPSPPGRVEAGSIRFHGENLLDLPLHELRRVRGGRIAYVFQDPLSTLNPLLRVGEQLVEAIREHQSLSRAQAWQRAVALLAQVQIADPAGRARSFPHELSGGMRQRVGIAMALANDPEIIIADEPSTALDVTVQAEILRLLDNLRRERNAALLFITHDFGVVSAVCDRLLVMYAGRVVETGTVQELFADPRHPYTRRLLDCVPRLGEPGRAMDAIPGLPPPVHELPPGCPFAPRCDRVVAACRKREIPLVDFAPGRAVACIRAGAGAGAGAGVSD